MLVELTYKDSQGNLQDIKEIEVEERELTFFLSQLKRKYRQTYTVECRDHFVIGYLTDNGTLSLKVMEGI
jgi:hypothetical protein